MKKRINPDCMFGKAPPSFTRAIRRALYRGIAMDEAGKIIDLQEAHKLMRLFKGADGHDDETQLESDDGSTSADE